MEQNFLILALADATNDRRKSDRKFSLAAGKDPVVRMFLTATLTAIGLKELRAFFRADETGGEILQL